MSFQATWHTIIPVIGETNRPIILSPCSTIAADVYVRGPLSLGADASINARCHIDGGTAGVEIGSDTRIGPGCSFFAFNHGIAPDRLVREQPVTSEGIAIGVACWIGADVKITDGVRLGDHCVVGIGSVVTNDVSDWAVVAGNPARVVGDRRHRG